MVLFWLGGAFLLGVCIFIHELGHFLLGRAVGIRAEIFSIGYGRGIWKRKIGDTTWQITAIPLGGYVKFYEDDYRDGTPTPGGFLSAHPLRRIIPVLGGPLFNLILGFLVFIVIHLLSGPLAPRVQIAEDRADQSPAYQGGLRNGDWVVAIGSEPVHSFTDIQKQVALSSGNPLTFEVDREGKRIRHEVRPAVSSSGIAYIGLRPPGARYLEVSYPNGAVWEYRFRRIFGNPEPPPNLVALRYLNDGDIILAVNDRPIHSISQLKRTLGEFHDQNVRVRVRRQVLPLITAGYTREVEVTMPSKGRYELALNNIVDLKYGGRLPDRSLESHVPEHQRGLSELRFDGSHALSFEHLFKKFGVAKDVELTVGDRRYRATVQAHRIGLLGFSAADRFESEYTARQESALAVFALAWRDTKDNIALYPAFFQKLFSGRMSFIDNAIGPVGMFAVAGQFVSAGWVQYLQLMAVISIALMVMNLLPIPIVDGGHIVFFLYEWVAGRPVSVKVMDVIHRVAFSGLLFLGLWIMYRDILRFVIQ